MRLSNASNTANGEGTNYWKRCQENTDARREGEVERFFILNHKTVI